MGCVHAVPYCRVRSVLEQQCDHTTMGMPGSTVQKRLAIVSITTIYYLHDIKISRLSLTVGHDVSVPILPLAFWKILWHSISAFIVRSRTLLTRFVFPCSIGWFLFEFFGNGRFWVRFRWEHCLVIGFFFSTGAQALCLENWSYYVHIPGNTSAIQSVPEQNLRWRWKEKKKEKTHLNNK